MQPSNVSPISQRNANYRTATQPRIQPNMYQTKFKAFNRQVEENQPGQLSLRFVDEARTKGLADIENQAKEQSEAVGKSGPNVSEFLPTFQKSLEGDQGARAQTAQNLQSFLPEFRKSEIDTAMEDDAMNLLGQQNRAGYLTALLGERGGLFGQNALDAAILDRSGAGRKMFEQGRAQLAGMTDIGNQKEAAIKRQYDQKAAELQSVKDAILSQVTQNLGGLDEKARQKIAQASKTMPLDEIQAIVKEAQAMRPDLPIQELADYSPFVDRELSFEEALSGADADTFNYLASLAGKNQVNFRSQDPSVDRSKLLRALLDQGQTKATAERQAQLDKVKAEAKSQEDKKKSDYSRQLEIQKLKAQIKEMERPSNGSVSPLAGGYRPNASPQIEARMKYNDLKARIAQLEGLNQLSAADQTKMRQASDSITKKTKDLGRVF